MTAEEVSSRPFLFWLKKKKERKKLPTVSLIGSTCVCFCRMTVLPVFDLTHFDWSFPEMHWRTANQRVFYYSTASSGRRLLVLPPPPTPTVHSNSKSNMAGRINGRELITLARTNTTPALQARSYSALIFIVVWFRINANEMCAT